MPDYLNLADLFVMPSITEALALVYLEIMACGRVLVATDIPAAREVGVDGETALLFRPGDVAHLTTITLRAAADAALRAAIGRQARAAVQRFDVRRTVDAYEILLRHLADQPPVPVSVNGG